MANSDNVIRAGLTPKLRDVPNLISGLTYNAAEPSKHTVKPGSFYSSALSTLYDPPIPEFSVVQVKVPTGAMETHPKLDGPSIVIVTEGGGSVNWGNETLGLGQGDVFFVGAGTEISMTNGKGPGEDFILYRAYVEAN